MFCSWEILQRVSVPRRGAPRARRASIKGGVWRGRRGRSSTERDSRARLQECGPSLPSGPLPGPHRLASSAPSLTGVAWPRTRSGRSLSKSSHPPACDERTRRLAGARPPGPPERRERGSLLPAVGSSGSRPGSPGRRVGPTGSKGTGSVGHGGFRPCPCLAVRSPCAHGDPDLGGTTRLRCLTRVMDMVGIGLPFMEFDRGRKVHHLRATRGSERDRSAHERRTQAAPRAAEEGHYATGNSVTMRGRGARTRDSVKVHIGASALAIR